MSKDFEMTMTGELTFLLGLQITQSPKGMFITQSNYLKEILKMFGMDESEIVSTPMTTSCKLGVTYPTSHKLGYCNAHIYI
jgi:hypothetical protein